MPAGVTTSPARHSTVSQSAIAIEIVADGLTDHGFDIRNPAREERSTLKITNARAALIELSIKDNGEVEWEYHPLDGSQANPRVLAVIVACLLGAELPATAGTRPQPCPPWTLKGIAGRQLADAGLQVALTVIGIDDYAFDVYTEIIVTSQDHHERGAVSLADDGTVTWQCRIDDQTGLSLADISESIALALTSTHHANDV